MFKLPIKNRQFEHSVYFRHKGMALSGVLFKMLVKKIKMNKIRI